jgi:hypothetical protein
LPAILIEPFKTIEAFSGTDIDTEALVSSSLPFF